LWVYLSVAQTDPVEDLTTDLLRVGGKTTERHRKYILTPKERIQMLQLRTVQTPVHVATVTGEFTPMPETGTFEGKRIFKGPFGFPPLLSHVPVGRVCTIDRISKNREDLAGGVVTM